MKDKKRKDNLVKIFNETLGPDQLAKKERHTAGMTGN